MVTKTLTGLTPFDQRFGGVFQGRVMLVTARQGSGKTMLGLQFLHQALAQGERALMLSATPSRDIAILAKSIGMPVDTAVEAGELLLLEYNDYIPGRDAEQNIMLPPESFAQLQLAMEEHGIHRVVLDTVLPWLTFTSSEHMAEHVFSFIRAFERIGVTALFTCPRPASTGAQRIHKLLSNNVPVAVSLMLDPATGQGQWVTNKYLGESTLAPPFSCSLERGKGIVLQGGDVPQRESHAATPFSTLQDTSAVVPEPVRRTHSASPFASVVLDRPRAEGNTRR